MTGAKWTAPVGLRLPRASVLVAGVIRRAAGRTIRCRRRSCTRRTRIQVARGSGRSPQCRIRGARRVIAPARSTAAVDDAISGASRGSWATACARVQLDAPTATLARDTTNRYGAPNRASRARACRHDQSLHARSRRPRLDVVDRRAHGGHDAISPALGRLDDAVLGGARTAVRSSPCRFRWVRRSSSSSWRASRGFPRCRASTVPPRPPERGARRRSATRRTYTVASRSSRRSRGFRWRR